MNADLKKERENTRSAELFVGKPEGRAPSRMLKKVFRSP